MTDISPEQRRQREIEDVIRMEKEHSHLIMDLQYLRGQSDFAKALTKTTAIPAGVRLMISNKMMEVNKEIGVYERRIEYISEFRKRVMDIPIDTIPDASSDEKQLPPPAEQS